MTSPVLNTCHLPAHSSSDSEITYTHAFAAAISSSVGDAGAGADSMHSSYGWTMHIHRCCLQRMMAQVRNERHY